MKKISQQQYHITILNKYMLTKVENEFVKLLKYEHSICYINQIVLTNEIVLIYIFTVTISL